MYFLKDLFGKKKSYKTIKQEKLEKMSKNKQLLHYWS